MASRATADEIKFCLPKIITVLARVTLTLLLLSSSYNQVNSKKKSLLKASSELLDRETNRLKTEDSKCSLSNLTLRKLDNLRALNQVQKGIDCHIKYLSETDEAEGWIWSCLGSLYARNGNTKSNTHASNCFKQAAKLDGNLSKFVTNWYFIGPFVIGKMEVDGDPVAAYGGIHNISRDRFKRSDKYHSELMPNGEVSWEVYKQTKEKQMMQISPQINWNDFINSLGSVAITEWQGWVLGEFAVNANNNDVLVQCLGVHTIYINNISVTGDIYHRDQFYFAVQLEKGIHTISIRLRTKAAQSFQCTLKLASSNYEILKPHYLPDLYDWKLFSSLLYIPISNLMASKWLRITKVAIQEQSGLRNLKISIHENCKPFSIAPGQVKPIILRLLDPSEDVYDNLVDNCNSLNLKLKLSTSDGNIVYPLSLRCRKKRESFIFTFLDHDGSVQHAAAIEPLEPCAGEECPTLLTLHGTTVPAQNQADSYKRMINGKFVFGSSKAWVLAPTRHGAHNWEGPGALTALTALKDLARLTFLTQWIMYKASAKFVVFAGHSMGGHGAWHLSTHYPDMALSVVSLAGWMKKEEYGDSNIFFRHDISTTAMDPAVKAIIESCIAENEADKHASNLQGIPVMTRIGAQDRTIHPYFVRRMSRVLHSWRINVTYVEIPKLEHWWWDTKETNDGGCVNDKQIRDFTDSSTVLPKMPVSCTVEQTSSKCHEDRMSKYSKAAQAPQSFQLTVYNPAFGGSMHGMTIMQQQIPMRMSTAKVTITTDTVVIKTTNVLRLSLVTSLLRPVYWEHVSVHLDNTVWQPSKLADVVDSSTHCFCKHHSGTWNICIDCDVYQEQGQRGPENLGPARRIAENKFVIVIGTLQTETINKMLQEMAVYLANLFFLTSDTLAPIVKDIDLTEEMTDSNNVIIIGGPSQNKHAGEYLGKVPVQVTEDTLKLGQNCDYNEPHTGMVFLAPHNKNKLSLVILGLSIEGLQDVISLATPTIPPMTRSPFSNLIPDFIVTGPSFRAHGPGGYLCAGFWGNNWDFRPELSSCAYCA